MNNKCKTYQEQIPASLEGYLTPELQANLESHLKDCDACQQELMSYQALTQMLYSVGDAIRSTYSVDEDIVSLDTLLKEIQDQEVDAQETYSPIEDVTEWRSLKVHEQALYELGDEIRAKTPDIDLCDDIMAMVALESSISTGSPDPLEDALYALGDQFRHNTPKIDILPQVMAALKTAIENDEEGLLHSASDKVEKLSQPMSHTSTVVNLAEYRKRQATSKPNRLGRKVSATFVSWGLVAAMIMLISVAGYQIAFYHSQDLSGNQIAMNGGEGTGKYDQTIQSITDKEAVSINNGRDDNIDAMRNLISNLLPGADDTTTERPARQVLREISLKDALDARQKAGKQDGEAINTLRQWAGLSSMEASRLLEDGELDIDALIGAGLFLTPEEAIALLRDAVENDPDNPFLRYALARNLSLVDGGLADSLLQMEAWSGLDGENALPHYYNALAHFSLGDSQAALASLHAAEGMSGASAYALDAARYTEQILVAGGMNPETARFLAATTAGSGQYSDLTALSQELLNYGSYYESIGDYETAKEIYQSLNNLGNQVADGAIVANERLAGMDIQFQSINAFEGLQDIFQDPANIRILEQTFNSFVQTLSVFTQYMEDYNQLLSVADINLASVISDIIFQQGDLNIFNFIPQSEL